MATPLLAEFAVRLAGGLAALLLLTPWRLVPPAFFRTHCGVILGLLVLAALDGARSGGDRVELGLAIGSAVVAYLASVAWGLGLPRLGLPMAALVVAAAIGWLTRARGFGLDFAGALASAFVLGSTLSAMLLGHYYLTAPAMSIEPLKRFVRCMAGALAIRTVLAALALGLWWRGASPGGAGGRSVEPIFLAMRWGMGLAGPILATVLAAKTVAIRSTQSATGILYIAMTLLLFGEVASLVLSREAGLPL